MEAHLLAEAVFHHLSVQGGLAGGHWHKGGRFDLHLLFPNVNNRGRALASDTVLPSTRRIYRNIEVIVRQIADRVHRELNQTRRESGSNPMPEMREVIDTKIAARRRSQEQQGIGFSVTENDPQSVVELLRVHSQSQPEAKSTGDKSEGAKAKSDLHLDWSQLLELLYIMWSPGDDFEEDSIEKAKHYFDLETFLLRPPWIVLLKREVEKGDEDAKELDRAINQANKFILEGRIPGYLPNEDRSLGRESR
jgi:hypothetical protein